MKTGKNAAIFAACAALCCACSTVGTTFSETVVTDDGLTTTTEYRAKSMAGPLGELDTSSHEFRYAYGGEENEIRAGQHSKGIDNTGQAVLVPLFQTLVEALVEAGRSEAPTPASAPPALNSGFFGLSPLDPLVDPL